MSVRRWLRTVGVVILIVVAACSGGDDDTADPERSEPTSTDTTRDETGTPTSEQPPETTADTAAPRPLAEVEIALSPIGQFDEPTVWATHPDGDSYVGEKAGLVRAASNGEVVLDLSDVVTADATEQGFLGLVFDESGEHLYVSYSERATDGGSVIAGYAFGDGRVSPD